MAQNQNQTSQATKKISNYITMIVLIVIALAIIALITAGGFYIENPNNADNVISAIVFATIGLVALTMSVFTLYQSRRQVAQMKIEIPKVMTIVECKKCNTKTVREFQRGDYVYKELDACPKCPDTKQLITAVYKEVKEKEKTYNV
jgi:ABC-type transport system involved in cytochrome bd biosynthesis fused ATPase/permease subunit